MTNTIIKENAYVERSIIDKKVSVGVNTKIGYGNDFTPNIEKPDLLSTGINVIAKSAIIPDNTTIERNCRIFDKAVIKDKVIKSGSTIK